MGLFDNMFGGRDRLRKNRIAEMEEQLNIPPQEKVKENGPVTVFNPTSYDDVATIIDSLKTGKTAVVHLTALKPETAIRIIDMLSGAVYALSGGVYEMEKNIFMFSPTGVEVN